ncbi:CGNR zinc finger domain-containing protein [Saccharopolyspora phatthalungensis]|uniref:Putative RNA-binding Zn ribbon-like protein n=1 Tax=Saccharopolyspora phatthalungensis TaxID=664693 RepID=A0A840QAB2_9PSEU|nr:CGNR zinc finger domain-containing protein [Saccharopolyspora phatthalungensis]MBB5156770.1 putative RNA-binding Zn ribbon-like protein [Saccharopolyspora phatthalungensis]
MAHDRPAAPGKLAPVEAFGNSARFRYGEDALADLASTQTWLREHGWHDAADELDEPAHQELVRARETIRGHLAGTDSTGLNDYASRLLRPPQWQDGQVVIPTANGTEVERLIGRLIAALALDGLTGKPGRLKVCHADDCRWLYYDRSPANNSTWCSMDSCGARHKMRAYRTRRKES